MKLTTGQINEVMDEIINQTKWVKLYPRTVAERIQRIAEGVKAGKTLLEIKSENPQ